MVAQLQYRSGLNKYRIAGNFRGVQFFAFFADRQVTAKIKTTKILTKLRTSRMHMATQCTQIRVRIGVWSEPQAYPTKIKTTKISSEGSEGISTKICTHENFPLYGIKPGMFHYTSAPFSRASSGFTQQFYMTPMLRTQPCKTLTMWYRWLDIVQSVVKRRVLSAEGDKFWSLSPRSRVNEQKLRPEYLALSLRTQCCFE